MAQDNSVVELDRRNGSGKAPALADINLESQVVGAVLNDPKAYKYCAGLSADAFSDEVLRELWTAICDLAETSRKATPASLAASFGPDRLESLGGRDMLANLAREGRALGGQLDIAVQRLRDLLIWRKLDGLTRDVSGWIGRRSLNADEAVSALLREAEGILQAGHAGARSKQEVARAALSQAVDPREPTPTMIESLDYLMHGGLMPRRMCSIGAETGCGKTILLGSISENLNAQASKHLHISLETPSEDIEIRNVARRMNANAAQIYDRESADHAKVAQNATHYLDHVPDNTFFEWSPGATIDDIRRYIIHASHRHGIEGVIIDYWQLIRGRERGQSEEGHLRDVANKLAEICRRENLWMLVAVQLDDAGRPKISDAIVQAAALHLRLMRTENDTVAHFRTEKSNYTRYADTGSSSTPGMIFRDEGPHFATPAPEDLTDPGAAQGDDAIEI